MNLRLVLRGTDLRKPSRIHCWTSSVRSQLQYLPPGLKSRDMLKVAAVSRALNYAPLGLHSKVFILVGCFQWSRNSSRTHVHLSIFNAVVALDLRIAANNRLLTFGQIPNGNGWLGRWIRHSTHLRRNISYHRNECTVEHQMMKWAYLLHKLDGSYK